MKKSIPFPKLGLTSPIKYSIITVSYTHLLLVRFAGCCSPVPGDKIVGYTSRGRGVVIHRADCPNIHGVDEGRLLPAAWNKEVHDKHRYNANIMIRATDQGAALSVLSGVVSDMKLSITAVNGRIDKNKDAVF